MVLPPGTTFQGLELRTTLGIPARLALRLVGRETAGPPRVALTFDDGPYPMYTPALLDLLRRHRARATFFLTGLATREYPDLARQVAREGHEVANHTFSHRREADLVKGRFRDEVLQAEEEILRVTGRRTRYFRPAGGRLSPEMRQTLGDLGYTTILWSVNTGDWWQRDPGALYRGVLRGRVRGGIVVMHSGSFGMLEALPTVLADLQRKGIRCVTVSELFSGAP